MKNNSWELSGCELNFTEFEMGKFCQENTFLQKKYNSKLFMLNKKIVEEFKEEKHSE